MSTTKVITGKVRFSYVNIFKSRAFQAGQDAKYSVCLLIPKEDKATIMPIVWACMDMARGKIGALIVIERATPLDDIVQTGELIGANVNKLLIENIFFKNSPLHDGAMIISHRRIRAAGCILPVSHDMDIPKELGLRHRAAMGISQSSDAIAIVVSEETGNITAAYKNRFKMHVSSEELEEMLMKGEF